MKTCRYKNLCKRPGSGCTSEDEESCPDAISLYANFCPIMVAAGISAQLCSCDIETIRKLWPKDKKCFDGQECLPRRYKTVQAQINNVTDINSISASFTAT